LQFARPGNDSRFGKSKAWLFPQYFSFLGLESAERSASASRSMRERQTAATPGASSQPPQGGHAMSWLQLKAALPGPRLAETSFCQWGRLALDPAYRTPEVLRRYCNAMIAASRARLHAEPGGCRHQTRPALQAALCRAGIPLRYRSRPAHPCRSGFRRTAPSARGRLSRSRVFHQGCTSPSAGCGLNERRGRLQSNRVLVMSASWQSESF